jgi:hypothetical protein
VPEDAIASVTAMGFTREQAIEALIVCNNDVQSAAAYLLSGL